MFKHDLKGLLAYSTISHLGLITFLIGLDSPLSSVAAVFHIVNHATFKASLFMTAGIIDHECGTRDMRRINGLWKYMPYTATLAIVAAAAMAGVPLLNGFLSKEMFFAEALDLRGLGLLGALAPGVVLAGGAFGVAYSARFIHDVFFNGEPRDLPRTPHEPPRFMKVPVEILAVVCLAVGMLPALTVAPLVEAAARAVVGAALPGYSIAIWHGFTAPLALSVLAFAGGAAMYWALQRKYNLHLHVPSGWTARLAFQHLMDAALAGAARVTNALENGSLQRSLVCLFAVALALGATPLVRQRHPRRRSPARADHAHRRGGRDRARRRGARLRGLPPEPARRGRARRRGRPRGVGGLPAVRGARPRADAARGRGRDDGAAAHGAGGAAPDKPRGIVDAAQDSATGSSPPASASARASSRWRR